MVINEMLDQAAAMALFLEDNVDVKKSYSVNVNFRREGNRLYTSIEVYGPEHLHGAREYSMIDLKRHRNARRVALAAAVILVAILIFIIWEI